MPVIISRVAQGAFIVSNYLKPAKKGGFISVSEKTTERNLPIYQAGCVSEASKNYTDPKASQNNACNSITVLVFSIQQAWLL